MHAQRLALRKTKNTIGVYGINLSITEAMHQSLIRKENVYLNYTFSAWMSSQAIIPSMRETVDNKAELKRAGGMFAISSLLESLKYGKFTDCISAL